MNIAIHAQVSPVVQAAIDDAGRTEDVRFSPENRLLAIAAFEKRHILILAVQISGDPAEPKIFLTDCIKLVSADIGLVHGLDFIDSHTLAVANRDGNVAIIPVPEAPMEGRTVVVTASAVIRDRQPCRLESPGSVVARRMMGGTELLVCNNYIHRVTRHWLGPGNRPIYGRKYLAAGLHIPDGIAVSHDGAWIAVSCHETGDVKLYRRRFWLGKKSHPDGIFSDVGSPHGLRFTPDDRHLIVADSGSRLIKVYEAGPHLDWSGERPPVRDVEVVDEATFQRGNHSASEGGPKGIDIDRTGTVVAVTCEEVPLAFFPLRAFLGNRGGTQSVIGQFHHS